MAVLYCYYRYHRYYEQEIESVEMALWRALSDIDNTQASPVKIVCEDGTVLEREEVVKRAFEFAEMVEGDG